MQVPLDLDTITAVLTERIAPNGFKVEGTWNDFGPDENAGHKAFIAYVFPGEMQEHIVFYLYNGAVWDKTFGQAFCKLYGVTRNPLIHQGGIDTFPLQV